jgi:hypothetical protein
MRRTRLLALGLSLVAGAAALGGASGTADAAGRWAPADRAAIHPGVQMYTEGAQCTANFVFTDDDRRVYVGYAAHCAGTGDATDTDGCLAESLPLGTRVRFATGGSLADGGQTVGRGPLVYSSWLTMQRLGGSGPDECAFNDFALVKVGRRYVDQVNPSVPYWGGPVGVAKDGTLPGDSVYSYGSSSLRAGIATLSPKVGTSLGDEAGGRSHAVYTISPGVPGDSGSGFLDDQGRALGVLSTLALAPLTGSNGVGDLPHELRYARQHSGIDRLRLVRGTEPFRPLL